MVLSAKQLEYIQEMCDDNAFKNQDDVDDHINNLPPWQWGGSRWFNTDGEFTLTLLEFAVVNYRNGKVAVN